MERRQTGLPDFSSASAMSVEVVVLPFVPVTPIIYMPFAGFPERIKAIKPRHQ